MIHWRVFPKGCTPTVLDGLVQTKTVESEFETNTEVRLQDIVLPEFKKNKHVDHQQALVFDGYCNTI